MTRRPARSILLPLLLCALLAAALPAGATAKGKGGPAAKLAATACVEQRAEIGKRAFRKRFGAKKTMRACIKRTRPRARRALATATAECNAELAEFGLEEFLWEWESFAECVATYAEWELGLGLDDDTGADDPIDEEEFEE